jgi:magnesium-transporting ATPase (P-type)
VRSALGACHRAGLRVAVVTGDHPGTARAVAEAVGLRVSIVVTGTDLPDHDDALGALIDRDGVVACRVSPEQKLRIARALQQRGHVVAMTGDGVNDGPALQQADIGIAMGESGTDVAREAADLVLLDDRFETIVEAVEQGRATFANIRRFLTYHLTDNVSELLPFVVWALSGGWLPLALGVLQILCLDLLTDQLPALALGAEPPAAHTLEQPPQRGPIVDRSLLVRALGVLGLTEALAALSTFTVVLISSGWLPGQPVASDTRATASGATMLAIMFGQCATAIACRSTDKPVWQTPLVENRLLLAALLVSCAIVALLLWVPPLAHILQHSPPTFVGFVCASLTFPLVVVADWVHKLRMAKATLRT